MKRVRYELHSPLALHEAAEKLRSSMDEKRWTPLSMSGNKGDREFLGHFRGAEFTVQKRRYSRNDFAGIFFGELDSEPSGTRIEGYFDVPRWSKYFMRFWLAGVVLLGIPIFWTTLSGALSGAAEMRADGMWVGLIVPPIMILFGLVLPKLGRLLGRSDERLILNHIKETLSAKILEDGMSSVDPKIPRC